MILISVFTFIPTLDIIITFDVSRWYEAGALIEGQTSDTLDLNSIERHLHGKAISCEATNSVGSTQQSYTLTIECRSPLEIINVCSSRSRIAKRWPTFRNCK